ncbi:MAG: anti-sigma factor [Gammaproteobacteria bacterium]|nr:anti-sigma factor [Gammaproteobacteria bacterium]
MSYETPVTEADLHAFMDGQLSESRRAVVASWLKEHPDKLRELADYQVIDRELHKMLDPMLDEPVPAGLRTAPGRRLVRRIAAVVAFLCVGGFAGWQANSVYHGGVRIEQFTGLEQHLIKPAAFAHVVYTGEQKHPVEVGADQEQHLVSWLSKRLRARIMAPDLRRYGYELVGGRLLPSTNRMAAQFMYQESGGERITLYVRRLTGAQAGAMFQFSSNNDINTFYWIEGELGYALSGGLPRDQLMTLATASYRQLQM